MQGGAGLGIAFHPSFPNTRQSDSAPMRKDGLNDRPGIVAMRSAKGMAGLLLAEVGGSMVEMDKTSVGRGSGFRDGRPIEPGAVTPMNRDRLPLSHTNNSRVQQRLHTDHRRGSSRDQGLLRQGTLLTTHASPTRRAEELKTLLGGSSAKVKSGAVLSVREGHGSKSPTAVVFEQGKSRARVTLDLVLENDTVVEGGYLSGCVHLRVRPKGKGGNLSLGGGKIRVAGFEVSPENDHRHIFYQVAAPLFDVSDGCTGLYSNSLDDEGFGSVEEGTYIVPFSLKLPIVNTGGKPKGATPGRSGTTIKYIAIVSMKVVDPNTGKRSIAHFYRNCEVWPALDPAITLAPAPQPIQAHTSKKLFMGGDGELSLSAALHRVTWVAGQPAHVRVRVINETRKTVRSLGLVLLRTTTVFRPSGRREGAVGFRDDPDACETETSEKRVAEATLTAGQKGAKGHVSAKGWWTGVGPEESAMVTHCITIPMDALTVTRSRLLEVEYSLRVSLGVSSITGNSDALHVILPIRVINFISLDPPPSGPMKATLCLAAIELNTPKPAGRQTLERPSTDSGIGSDSSRGPPTEQSGISSVALNIGPGERGRNNRSKSHNLDEISKAARDAGLPTPYDAYDHLQINTQPLQHAVMNARSRAQQTHRRTVRSPPPIARATHDLGALEDINDVHGVLGDIPGSVSLLEESDISDISADSGYEDVGYSDLSEREEGHDETDDDYDDRNEDIESDEELERMVGCASSQIDAGNFPHAVFPPTYGSRVAGPRKHRRLSAGKSSTGRQAYVNAQPIDAVALSLDYSGLSVAKRSDYRGRTGVARARGERSNAQTAASPQRSTFAERVHAKMNSGQASAQVQKAERAYDPNQFTSACVSAESPGSKYSGYTPSEDTPLQAKPITSNISFGFGVNAAVLAHGGFSVISGKAGKSLPRPPSMIARTQSTPAESTSAPKSADRDLESSSSRIHAPAEELQAGNGMSPVRVRIAMLEQKVRETEMSDSVSFAARPGPGARSMTVG